MSQNPYEPPSIPAEPPAHNDPHWVGPWRDGDFVVVRSGQQFVLPPRCVMTGVPVRPEQFIARSMYFSPTFFSWKHYYVNHKWPICDAARPLVPWLVLFSIPLAGAAITGLFESHLRFSVLLPSLAAVVVLILGVLAFEVIRARPFVEIVKADGDFVWLSGAHAEFLAELPPWTGPP